MLYLLIFLIFFFSSYFIQYSNSTTSSLSLNYWYFLSLFVLKNKNVIFYLNSNKRKLCSSNSTHFFNIYAFSNLSYFLYLFISLNILPWYHSSSFLLSFFILFLFIIILLVVHLTIFYYEIWKLDPPFWERSGMQKLNYF